MLNVNRPLFTHDWGPGLLVLLSYCDHCWIFSLMCDWRHLKFRFWAAMFLSCDCGCFFRGELAADGDGREHAVKVGMLLGVFLSCCVVRMFCCWLFWWLVWGLVICCIQCWMFAWAIRSVFMFILCWRGVRLLGWGQWRLGLQWMAALVNYEVALVVVVVDWKLEWVSGWGILDVAGETTCGALRNGLIQYGWRWSP